MAPLTMRPMKAGGEVRSGTMGSLSATSSPAASAVRTRGVPLRLRNARGVPAQSELLRREAQLAAAGADIERGFRQ